MGHYRGERDCCPEQVPDIERWRESRRLPPPPFHPCPSPQPAPATFRALLLRRREKVTPLSPPQNARRCAPRAKVTSRLFPRGCEGGTTSTLLLFEYLLTLTPPSPLPGLLLTGDFAATRTGTPLFTRRSCSLQHPPARHPSTHPTRGCFPPIFAVALVAHHCHQPTMLCCCS